MVEQLPIYARREGNTVYVQTAWQSFDVLNYLDPAKDHETNIVIEDRAENLRVRKALLGWELS